MARLLRITLLATTLAVIATVASAQDCNTTWTSCRIPGSHPPAVGFCCGEQQAVCFCDNPRDSPGPITPPSTAAPSSSQSSDATTSAPSASQPAEATTAAPYSSQPAEVTTAAPYSSAPSTTAAPYSSQPAEVTTAAPYASQPAEATTAAPYSSQPAEVTTAAPYSSAPPQTSAPYSSQPREVTTAAPYASQPAEITTRAPTTAAPPGTCQWVYIDAQFVLSGTGWTKVRANANAWSSLSGAVTSDLAFLLGRSMSDITIESIAVTSLTATANDLTIVFTVRSNALAEAARIAALIRDDIPSTAPITAIDAVYASVAQSSTGVLVTSHTGQSRDTYDCTGGAPSPSPSSNSNEITTQAPAGAASTGGYSSPSSSYTPSPSAYPVYASVLLSGDGWQQFAASAWAALKAAVTSDIAAALKVDASSITINIIQATGTQLQVNYTVMTSSVQDAGQISVTASQLGSIYSPLQLSSTLPLYSAADPSAHNVTVAAAWSSSAVQTAYSPAGSYTSWMPWLASAAVVAAFAVLRN